MGVPFCRLNGRYIVNSCWEIHEKVSDWASLVGFRSPPKNEKLGAIHILSNRGCVGGWGSTETPDVINERPQDGLGRLVFEVGSR